MYRETFKEPDEALRRLGPEELAMEFRQGVELAPRTLESLVTWDVSGHAQCEMERMSSLYRLRGPMRASYY
jgi:hypothetical protein